jgi:hypothetical protein
MLSKEELPFGGDEPMKRLMMATFAVMVTVSVGPVRAEGQADLVGNWKWQAGHGNKLQDVSLKVTMQDGKLAAAFVGPKGREIPVEHFKFDAGTLSFQVTVDRKGQQMTTTYSGKVSGDKVQGSMEASGKGGKAHKRDWTATRSKD